MVPPSPSSSSLPALHLTGQTWKLGSIERRERMRQLRDAGAGPSDLRRVAMADTGVPVLIGAVAGIVLLGAGLGLLNARGTEVQGSVYTPDGVAVPSGTQVLNSELPVVPNVVTAAWWPALFAVAVVALAATAAAARAVSRVDRPDGRTRSPGRMSGFLAGRTGRADLLLALRRLADEPGPTTRPALLLGLAAVVAGASTWLSRQYRPLPGPDGGSRTTSSPSPSTWSAWPPGWASGCARSVSSWRLRTPWSVAVAPTPRPSRAGCLEPCSAGRWCCRPWFPRCRPCSPGSCLVAGWPSPSPAHASATGSPSSAPLGPLVPFPWVQWLAWAVGILVVALCAALLASTALNRTTRTDQLRVPA